MEDSIPVAVWSGTFRVLGVDMKCHTLSDGQRIIEAESLEAFVSALRDASVPDDPTNHADLEAMMRWKNGFNQPRGLSAAEGHEPEGVNQKDGE